MGYESGLAKEADYVAVKVPVFSFPKLLDADNHLGPEMKSTGEVLGIAKDFETALFKGCAGGISAAFRPSSGPAAHRRSGFRAGS